MITRGLCAVLLSAACSVTPAVAHEDNVLNYDQIDLSASAEQEIENDLLIATLYTEHEGQRQSEVAARVNDTMAWALAQTKAASGVKTQTTQYTTYPVYANNGTTVTGWRARQALRLEARDTKLLGDLVATLQERLAVEAIGFGVSPERRTEAETALTDTALAQFQARAKQVAGALGRGGYRIVHLNVGTGGNLPGPIAYRGAMMMAEKSAAPAQIEAGTQTLNVTVSGTVQLDTH